MTLHERVPDGCEGADSAADVSGRAVRPRARAEGMDARSTGPSDRPLQPDGRPIDTDAHPSIPDGRAAASHGRPARPDDRPIQRDDREVHADGPGARGRRPAADALARAGRAVKCGDGAMTGLNERLSRAPRGREGLGGERPVVARLGGRP